ncbi:MAG TPA: hypothetical protein VMI94_20190 [Bryobacteraceae bacterium]|nr:hypothetical protein [Bryobacteraceae bacterium]
MNRVLILALLVSLSIACRRPIPIHHPSTSEARLAVVEAIKGQLMSPGLAHFSNEQEMNIDEVQPGRFRVRGFVDYQGAYDIPVRNNYTCVIHYNNRGQWELEEITWQ